MNVGELQARYEAACTFNHPVDKAAIALHLQRFFREYRPTGGSPLKRLFRNGIEVRFLTTVDGVKKAAKEAESFGNNTHINRFVLGILDGNHTYSGWSVHDFMVKSYTAERNASVSGVWKSIPRAAASAWNAAVTSPLKTHWAESDVSKCALTAIGAAEQSNYELFEKWLPIFEAFAAGAWMIYPNPERVYVVTLPERVRIDDQRRLHCEDGPAFVWQSVNHYYLRGVLVPERVVMQPETITVEEIDRQEKIEMRRVLLEQYGEARYIAHGGMDVEGLQARYDAACTFTQAVDRPTIVACLRQFLEDDALEVEFLESSQQINALDTILPKESSTSVSARLREKFLSPRGRPKQRNAFLRNISSAYDTVFYRALGDRHVQRDVWEYLPALINAAAQGDRPAYDRWQPLLEAFEAGACRLYPLHSKVCVVPPPQVIRADEQGRFHCADGPAFVWQDVEMYWWHGWLAPKAARRYITDTMWHTMTRRMPTHVVEQLTPDQEATLPAYAAKWEAIRQSTTPADRAMAEEGVRLTYAAVGLKPPREIIWTASPYATAVAHQQLFPQLDQKSHVSDVMIRIKVLLWDWLHTYLTDDIHTALRIALSSHRDIRDTLFTGFPAAQRQLWRVLSSLPKGCYEEYKPYRYSYTDHLIFDPPTASAYEVFFTQPRYAHPVFGSREPVDFIYSQHEPFRWALYDVARDVLGLIEETDPIRGMLLIAQSVNWWLPYEDVCWMSDRPRQLSFDTRNRLHRDDGPAIEYRDGWGPYAWHGVAVSERIIMRPELISIEDIDTMHNIEMRRIMLERYGEARYIEESSAELIHADAYGMLYRRTFWGDEALVMVRVVNSTPQPDGSRKAYLLRVPQTMSTAHEAVAWTFGMTPEQYRLQFES